MAENVHLELEVPQEEVHVGAQVMDNVDDDDSPEMVVDAEVDQQHREEPDFADHMFDGFEENHEGQYPLLMDVPPNVFAKQPQFVPVNHVFHHQQSHLNAADHRIPLLHPRPASSELKRPQLETDQDDSLFSSMMIGKNNDFPNLRAIVTKMIRVTHVSVLNEVPTLLCRKIYLMRRLHGPHPINHSFFSFLSER